MVPVETVSNPAGGNFSSLNTVDESNRMWTAIGMVSLVIWFLWLVDNSARPLDYVVSVAIVGATVFFGWKTFNIEKVLAQDILPVVKNGLGVPGQAPVVHVVPPPTRWFIPHTPRGTVKIKSII